MKPRFSVRLATESDNQQLLALTRVCPMEGKVTLCTERDPRYFTLNELQGHPWYVAVAEDWNGEIVGCASLALRHVYIDGKPTSCLYGGDLRIAPSARRSTVLRQLHDFLMTEVQPLGVQLGYISIIEGNRAARVLSRNLPGMPVYRRVGNIRVCAVSFLFPKKPSQTYSIGVAAEADLPEILALLNHFNSRHNFAPVWSEARFELALRRSPGLSLDCFYVARENSKIVGAMAIWDQGSFQRTRILNYPWSMAAYRYLYNSFCYVLGFPRLPGKGSVLRQLYVTHLGIMEDAPAIFNALLTRVHNDYRSQGYQCFTFGLAEDHPSLAGLRGFQFRSFRTVIYSMAERGSCWESHSFTKLPLFHDISHA
jgi:hypothetical protein